MARILKNQHQNSFQRETIPDKFVFFFQNGEQNACMYVFEICAEAIFVTFPW